MLQQKKTFMNGMQFVLHLVLNFLLALKYVRAMNQNKNWFYNISNSQIFIGNLHFFLSHHLSNRFAGNIKIWFGMCKKNVFY